MSATRSGTDRRQRVLRMPRYLATLRQLVLRDVNAQELGLPDQAAALRAQAQTAPPAPVATCTLAFAELRSPRFATFVQTLGRASAQPVLLWTQDTIYCGALELPTVADVYFGFGPDLDASGVLVIATVTLSDRLVLDWTVEPGRETILDLEVAGPAWSAVQY